MAVQHAGAMTPKRERTHPTVSFHQQGPCKSSWGRGGGGGEKTRDWTAPSPPAAAMFQDGCRGLVPIPPGLAQALWERSHATFGPQRALVCIGREAKTQWAGGTGGGHAKNHICTAHHHAAPAWGFRNASDFQFQFFSLSKSLQRRNLGAARSPGSLPASSSAGVQRGATAGGGGGRRDATFHA